MDADRKQFDRMLRDLSRFLEGAARTDGAANDYGTGSVLHRAEIHVVQAIGENADAGVSELAAYLGVTKGAISQTVGKLVEKGIVTKSPDPADARRVRLGLTPRGWDGFFAHDRAHQAMYDVARERFGERFVEKVETIEHAIADLTDVMETLVARKP